MTLIDVHAHTIPDHYVYQDLVLGYSAATLEYPFDTTRMILNLLSMRTLHHYPNMKLIVSNGGGTVPFLAERMSNLIALSSRAAPAISPRDVIAQLRTIYYDVTGISNSVSLASYARLVPAERRLYGSDTPGSLVFYSREIKRRACGTMRA